MQRQKEHHRSRYEDHRHHFLDWVDQMANERTWFGRLLLFIEQYVSTKKAIIVFVFSFLLSYAIFFQLKIPYNYQVGQPAPVDLVSPIDFSMVDEVTTEEKRIDAEADVPMVFDFDPLFVEQIIARVSVAFKNMRLEFEQMKLPRNGPGRQKFIVTGLTYKKHFESDLAMTIPDHLFVWLLENQFDVKLEDLIIKNLKFWYKDKLTEAPDGIVPRSHRDVVVRYIYKNQLGEEVTIQKEKIVNSKNLEEFQLQNSVGLEKLAEAERANVLTLARSLILPNLRLNLDEISKRRKIVRDAVLPVEMNIKKNQLLIKQGVQVQPYQMAIIEQIELLQNSHRRELLAIVMSLTLFVMIYVFGSYAKRFTVNRVKIDYQDILIMMSVALLQVILTKIFIYIADVAILAKFVGYIPATSILFAAPVAAAPMIVGLVITYGEVVWLFTAFLSIALGIMVDFNFPFMLVTLLGGIAGARGVFNCKKRNDIYFAGLRVGIVNSVMVFLLFILQTYNSDILWKEVLWAVPAGFLGGIFSSWVAMLVIPIVESIFNCSTDVRLLELSNLNHPLLKEMIVKAPGTYHHSMMVGSMVEAAAEEIGANPLLAKVMAYYHDIGKTEHAKYYIENQKPGQNPHDHISPFMSKTLLIAHVKDGIELGMKYKLGKPILDGIIQHHGTTAISYFYNKALDQKSEEDPEIHEDEFRYPGPKPQFREAALCMLADSIEAAARSLDEPTPVRLQNIVHNVIQRKFLDAQLDECNLTLKDLSKVEAAFTRILLGIYHQRIDYPRSAGGGLSEK